MGNYVMEDIERLWVEFNDGAYLVYVKTTDDELYVYDKRFSTEAEADKLSYTVGYRNVVKLDHRWIHQLYSIYS